MLNVLARGGLACDNVVFFPHVARHTGYSDYVNFVKIRHAADEINSGNKSITEVCYKHGFGSLATFYRCFKQHYGTTPKGLQKGKVQNLS